MSKEQGPPRSGQNGAERASPAPEHAPGRHLGAASLGQSAACAVLLARCRHTLTLTLTLTLTRYCLSFWEPGAATILNVRNCPSPSPRPRPHLHPSLTLTLASPSP